MKTIDQLNFDLNALRDLLDSYQIEEMLAVRGKKDTLAEILKTRRQITALERGR